MREKCPSLAGGGAPASEQIALLNRRTCHCKRLPALNMKSALTPKTSFSVLEDLLQVMQRQLEELVSMNAAKMGTYRQLMERMALTDEAISAIQMQDEASELEYRAEVADRDR